MYDRDGGGRSATPTGFAFVWITCLCHMSGPCGDWSSGLCGALQGGAGQARMLRGCGALEEEINLGNACNFGRRARSVKRSVHHSVSCRRVPRPRER